jgi:hypothetical protein
MNVSTVLLGAWFALIAAERIDFAGGDAPFRVTPFLVLTPIVVVAEIIRRWRQRTTIEVSQSVVIYMALAGALLALAITSSVFALRVETSAPRVALLIAQVTGLLAIALLTADRPNLLRILATGAAIILPFYILADVAEARWMLGRGPELWRLGTITLRFDELQTWGLLPRLPGLVVDANRTGYALLVYGVVVARGEPRPVRRRVVLSVIALLMLLTMSRSTLLAVAATAFVALVTRVRPMSMKAVAVAMTAITIAAALTLVTPGLQRALATAGDSRLVDHFSGGDESARGHVMLLERGIAEGASSIHNSLIGVGFGNAYLVLEDVFPSNRYGNFHSLYISMFAEVGVFALLLIGAIVLTPVFMGGPWRSLAGGAAIFNIFYQTTADPVFWLVITMGWLTMTVRERRARS